jgi:hypothetical protein
MFKEPVLRKLWEEEISGQISDGAWENISNKANTALWADSEIVSGPSNVIINLIGSKPYVPGKFTEELEPVWDRMKSITGLDDAGLTKALNKIQNMVRFTRPPKEGEPGYR